MWNVSCARVCVQHSIYHVECTLFLFKSCLWSAIDATTTTTADMPFFIAIYLNGVPRIVWKWKWKRRRTYKRNGTSIHTIDAHTNTNSCIHHPVLMTANWRRNATKLLQINSGYPCVKASNRCEYFCLFLLHVCVLRAGASVSFLKFNLLTILNSLSLSILLFLCGSYLTSNDSRCFNHLLFDKNQENRRQPR